MLALRSGASQLVGRSSVVTAAAHRISAASAAASAVTARDASTLVVSEPTHDGTLPASTLSAITAATQLDGGSGDITLLTLSDGSHPPVDPSSVPSQVNQTILQVKLDGGSGALLAETVAEAVKAAAACGTFTHVVAASSKFGANFVPRAGALLGVSPVPDVVEILGEGRATFVYAVWRGMCCVDEMTYHISYALPCDYLFAPNYVQQ